MADYDMLICPLCSDIVPESQARGIVHQWRGGMNAFDVCRKCATRDEPLCHPNPHGIHGMVVTDDESLFRESVLPPALRPLWRETPHQWGYCENCQVPMNWNVDEQRWCAVKEENDGRRTAGAAQAR